MSSDLPPPFGLELHADGSATAALPLGTTATGAELCLFADEGTESRIPLTERLGTTWWAELPAGTVGPGTRYGIRVAGDGHNRAKLLTDPWARAIEGTVDWLTKPGVHRLVDPTDTAPYAPRSVVIDRSFDWAGDARPNTPWTDTVIYEVHVKGATKTHPGVPENLRGTYAGFCHPAFVDHLVALGVTAVELLPIHHYVPEERLAGLGLTNYWGYNTLGFLAPHAAYAHAAPGTDAVRECKGMIKLLHEAGIEVILDVVYNHSCEAGPGGAALSLRGLDPNGWYRPYDVTGCGNSLDLNHPYALTLVMDSLRYWVQEFHVDGFRFDLAATLGRGRNGDFESAGVFLNAVAQDPILSGVKLIAEAWDIGDGGYQVGSFPAPWAEWNDRYRDLMRDHWNNAPRPLGAVARRITGNPDLFAASGRRPWASVNLVTAHDGFCLRDLVSYNDKHNEANGEGNRDGSNDNRSWNHGVEGPTADPKINSARARTQRNLLATLLLSQGTPMLVGGDEIGRTQRGNNNAYCLDNETSWLDWSAVDKRLLDFVRALTKIRSSSAVFRQREWLTDTGAQWFAPDGTAMTIERWDDPEGCGLQLLLRGATAADDRLVVLHEWITAECFTLPEGDWIPLLTTTLPDDAPVMIVGGVWEPQFPTLAVFSRR
jgi:isoamylase